MQMPAAKLQQAMVFWLFADVQQPQAPQVKYNSIAELLNSGSGYCSLVLLDDIKHIYARCDSILVVGPVPETLAESRQQHSMSES